MRMKYDEIIGEKGLIRLTAIYLSKVVFAKCHVLVSRACNRSCRGGVCAPMGGSSIVVTGKQLLQ